MTSVSNAAVGAYLAGNAAAKARHGMNEAIARLSTGVRAMYGGDAGGASAAMLVSAGPTDQNLGGLRVLVRLDRSVVLPSFRLSGTGAGKGSATVPLPLPNMPVLIGARFHAQAVVIDPKGSWVGIAATPGLAMTLKP